MKDTFFTLLALSIPVVILGGLFYMFGQGLYTVSRDWWERRQMDQLRRETAHLRQQRPPTEEPVPKAAAEAMPEKEPAVPPSDLFTMDG